ncbi:MAG: deoxyribodipyrimidine photo-lyase [Bdellovibrio sp.]
MRKCTIFWFRRDLRCEDNAGLFYALKEHASVLPVFIFDTDILEKLEDPQDARVTFIYQAVQNLKEELQSHGSDLLVRYGSPLAVFKELAREEKIEALYFNHDYEPAARKRDAAVTTWAQEQGIEVKSYKDQCLFEKNEIVTSTQTPYTVFTPYKKKVLSHLDSFYLRSYPLHLYAGSYARRAQPEPMPSLQKLGFRLSTQVFAPAEVPSRVLKNYAQQRDFPALEQGTSHLGVHLRFGTVSIREWAREGKKLSETWLSELIWRDFFMQILWHFPQVEKKSFRPEYDRIAWRSSKADWERWCEGQTGYPFVDAGMRELNATGFMHNRVRMITASFLCKHLLIHWYEGERYFAKKLLDYDLAANNGNWQWAAGSGCDAAPYFRIFNPMTQAEKFDPDSEYIRKWVPEWGTDAYPAPMIDHVEARGRCLQTFTKALKK